MIDALLIYPYTDLNNNNSIFRFPPLGLGYIASYLQKNGFSVKIIDATFQGEEKAIKEARNLRPRVVGIYSMFTMKQASLRFAEALRDSCELSIMGGPLPSVEPESFLDSVDIVAVGEGEETMLRIVDGKELEEIDGIVYHDKGSNQSVEQQNKRSIVYNPVGAPISDLDSIPLPARELFDNKKYISYYKQKGKPSTTSIISSRGCPFACDFCSRPVFGSTFRERSASNIADEVEQVQSLGYEHLFFQDDCFTLTKRRVRDFCEEVKRRSLRFNWDCLSRVDTLDFEVATEMKTAGCERVFFGLESGSDRILKIMNKSTTAEKGKRAVEAASLAGLKTGAFFIIGYPGDDDDSMLETFRFANKLPLEYLSFTLPYPIPGTGLYERVKNDIITEELNPQGTGLAGHSLIFRSNVSEFKLKVGMGLALAQFKIRKLGQIGNLMSRPIGYFSKGLFRLLK